MKLTAFVLLALSAALLETSAGLAQQVAKPPVEPAAPVTPEAPVPLVASPTPPVAAAPPEVPAFAPAPVHTRSLKKAPALAVPVPETASKPEPGTPDVVVGGLPGNQSATAVEKQP